MLQGYSLLVHPLFNLGLLSFFKLGRNFGSEHFRSSFLQFQNSPFCFLFDLDPSILLPLGYSIDLKEFS